MHIKRQCELTEFLAGDHTYITELLHPKNDNIKLPYSLAHARLGIGASSLPHRLRQSETYYIVQGEGLMFIDGKSETLKEKELVFIPEGAEQYIQNTGNVELCFLCIVAPAWSEEGEEVSSVNSSL